MRIFKSIIILIFLCGGFEARAQEPGELSAIPEQWQLTLDVIKSKAQTLVVENNGLQDEYRQLSGQVQELQQAIEDQQSKNGQMDHFIKQRHGRTDQQLRVEELIKIVKTKKQEVRVLDGQLGNMQEKKSSLNQKIQSLKYMISSVELHQQEEKEKARISTPPELPPGDDQLVQLRKQLEDQDRQEVLLENEMGALKTVDKTKNLNGDTIEAENKQLELRLDVLRLQKLQRASRSTDALWAQAEGRMYDKLKKRKEELEANISAYELRLDELRGFYPGALSWPLKKKRMVHEMVQTDALNNRMREKIKVLREDISLLKDQMAGLERRVDSAKVKDVNFISTP